MKSNVLNENLEWEAQRHAVAWGLSSWDVIGYDCEEGLQRLSFRSKTEELWIECWFELEEDNSDWGLLIDDYGGGPFMEDDMFVQLESSNDEVTCEAYLPPSKKNKANNVVARLMKAAYLLERPLEPFETELGLTLSHHEKLELRLSMPREFWTPKWLDEENDGV